MSVDIVTFLQSDLKNSIVELFNEANDTNHNPDMNIYNVNHTGDDKTIILQNPLDRRGLVADKIDVSNLFMNTIDLRTFKKKRVLQTKVIEESEIAEFNKKHGVTLVTKKRNLDTTTGGYPPEVVADFNLFCRVTGFYELSILDVVITTDYRKMTMTVVPSHKYLTGTIEVST